MLRISQHRDLILKTPSLGFVERLEQMAAPSFSSERVVAEVVQFFTDPVYEDLTAGDIRDIGGAILLSNVWQYAGDEWKQFVAESFALRVRQLDKLQHAFNPHSQAVERAHAKALNEKDRIIADFAGKLIAMDRGIPDKEREGASRPVSQTSIISHGNKSYSVGDDGPKLTVTPSEDCVLQAFIESRTSLDTDSLIKLSGVQRAAETLRKLTTKYDGVFGKFITRPGGKGRGGYSVIIRRVK